MLIVVLGQVSVRAEDRALLIGIDDYREIQSLVGSKNDVRNMHRFVQHQLGYRPGQVKTLLDGEATRAGILRALDEWLIQGTRPGDRVLFYYSGHGHQMPDTDADEDDALDETLMSVDTYRDEGGTFGNMVSDDELRRVFDRLGDRDVTVIVDSCHSGTVTRAFLPMQDSPYRKTPRSKAAPMTRGQVLVWNPHRQEESLIPASHRRVVWSAASAAQVAFVDRQAQPPEGVFTRRFLAGLQDNAADRNGNGRVSNAELLDYVRDASQDYCRRPDNHCALGLTPTLEIDTLRLAEPVFATKLTTRSTAELASELFAHGNSAQVRLELLPRSVFRLGETMRFRVTSPREGYLVLLDINARGEVIQLFPNRYSERAGKRNRITANRPITIPDRYYGFQLTAAEPLGHGRLLAIISEDPVELEDLLAAHRGLAIVANPEVFLAALAERLREVWTGEQFNRQVKWSLAQRDYEIVD